MTKRRRKWQKLVSLAQIKHCSKYRPSQKLNKELKSILITYVHTPHGCVIQEKEVLR